MTDHDLIGCVAELLHENSGELRDAGVTSELNLQGWLGARNLRLVAADPREPEVSPAFWIAEHHDGRCDGRRQHDHTTTLPDSDRDGARPEPQPACPRRPPDGPAGHVHD